MTDKSKAYKLLIHGTLMQKTAFSTGGNRHEIDGNRDTDNLLAKDGKGRYTIRGSSLAGAFIATARTLYKKLPSHISENTPAEQGVKLRAKFKASHQRDYGKWLQEQPRMKESLWIFHHAHPLKTPMPEIRDNVAIRQDTGATREGAKFDVEILPVGTQWTFLLEVDEYRDTDDNTASSIALNVIKEWQQHCWLGRDVARGLGRMQLQEVKVYQLEKKHISLWPNSHKTPYEPLQALSRAILKPDEIKAIQNKKTAEQVIHQLSGSIVLTVGASNDGYGLDMLSVGGNNNDINDNRQVPYRKDFKGKRFLEKHPDKLLTPQDQNEEIYLQFPDSNTSDADFTLALTQGANGVIIPHVPGSSLRGALRHTLSWLLRKQGEAIWEPGETEKPNDIVHHLFGSTQQSASLLVSDALPKNTDPLISDALPKNTDWKMVVLEMHAEDEFTQGAYAGSKFDRTCLTKGTFKAHYHLQHKDESIFNDMVKQIQSLQQLGSDHFIPIGGGQWKGMGWIKIAINIDEQTITESPEEESTETEKSEKETAMGDSE